MKILNNRFPRAVVIALTGVALLIPLAGAQQCTDTPPPASAPGGAVADQPQILVRVYGNWNTKPARHHDIEMTLTYGRDPKHPVELVIPWEHGYYDERYPLRAGDTISVTFDQQEEGTLNCYLQNAATHAMLGNSPQFIYGNGAITCRYLYGLHPAGWQANQGTKG